MQKKVAAAVGLHPSNYCKIEKGERDISIEGLDKIARFFAIAVDQIIHNEGKLQPSSEFISALSLT